jgi:endonuclease/exonuclease/phosphatase family metal-dependent hydrolase
MVNVVDVGFGQLKLFQTHLYFGDGLPDIRVPAVYVPILSKPSDGERMNVWRDELAELADFYRQHHQPQNVAIITGDFNMSGANVREYTEIRRTMDSLNMRDLWAWDVYNHHPSKGYTCRFTDGDPSQWKRDFNDVCKLVPEQLVRRDPTANSCDDLRSETAPPSGVGRYDYIFAENPTAAHRYNLETSRIQRRPFPRAQETDNENFLSDHLGLDLTLYLSPR